MMDDIKDIKPPLELPAEYFWVWISLAIFLLVGIIAYFLFQQRRKAGVMKILEPILPPWEVALKRLEVLGVKGLEGKGMWREYYAELSSILRHYIEGRFEIHAPEMTTQEFLHMIKADDRIQGVHKQIFKDFLNLCDMIKFAQHASNKEEALRSFELVVLFVGETKIKDGI